MELGEGRGGRGGRGGRRGVDIGLEHYMDVMDGHDEFEVGDGG